MAEMTLAIRKANMHCARWVRHLMSCVHARPAVDGRPHLRGEEIGVSAKFRTSIDN
jgi:hypothetical protein